jgi:hypothetical protein
MIRFGARHVDAVRPSDPLPLELVSNLDETSLQTGSANRSGADGVTCVEGWAMLWSECQVFGQPWTPLMVKPRRK